MDQPKRYWHIVVAVHRDRCVPIPVDGWIKSERRPTVDRIINAMEARVRAQCRLHQWVVMDRDFSIVPTVIDPVSEEDYNHGIAQ